MPEETVQAPSAPQAAPAATEPQPSARPQRDTARAAQSMLGRARRATEPVEAYAEAHRDGIHAARDGLAARVRAHKLPIALVIVAFVVSAVIAGIGR